MSNYPVIMTKAFVKAHIKELESNIMTAARSGNRPTSDDVQALHNLIEKGGILDKAVDMNYFDEYVKSNYLKRYTKLPQEVIDVINWEKIVADEKSKYHVVSLYDGKSALSYMVLK